MPLVADNNKEFFRALDARKAGFICKNDLMKIVNQVYHLVPQNEKDKMLTPEMFADELITEMDKDEVDIGDFAKDYINIKRME